jgi:hypothetical protein
MQKQNKKLLSYLKDTMLKAIMEIQMPFPSLIGLVKKDEKI